MAYIEASVMQVAVIACLGCSRVYLRLRALIRLMLVKTAGNVWLVMTVERTDNPGVSTTAD